MVKDSSVTSLDAQMEADYRQDVIPMKSELMKAKAFESSKLHYAFKVTSNAAILASAVAAIVLLNGMSGAVICGVLMALFWQQCGWLAHDFLHYQVFTNRMYNNLAGLCIGNIWQASQQHVGKPSITTIMPHQTWCILRLEETQTHRRCPYCCGRRRSSKAIQKILRTFRGSW